jgi:hypothetical protein
VIYLASPYSHPDPAVREARFEAVCEKAAAMMRDGLLVYSPIAHSHPLARRGLPGDWLFWALHNAAMMRACSRVVVLQLDGWGESEGVSAEVRLASDLGLPVSFDQPLEVVYG